ncbi:MAG TPA: hypothetical protein VF796_14015, partial [Humisphaera sp.]
ADVRDPAILGAKTRYAAAVQAANARLADAYAAAVRDYTRAKQIDQALAVQAELDGSGLGKGGPAGTVPAPAGQPAVQLEAITRLAKVLPPQLTTTESFEPAREGGIVPKGTVKTKVNDFVLRNKNFVFDVWAKIEGGKEARVGIGDGSFERSLGLICRGPGDQNHDPRLFHGDPWGKIIGEVREPGVYVFRLERHGGPMTFSVGAERDGAIDFFASRTVQNPKATQRALDDRVTPLFFGGSALFKQFRLTILPPAPPAADPGDAVVRLGRDLSPALVATGAYAAQPGGGIRLVDGCRLETAAVDFLDKDFVFDVWFTTPATTKDWTNFGIGEGTVETSLAMSVRSDGDRSEALITKGDEWHGPKMGPFATPGDYVARVEKRGPSMTFTLGTEEGGKFVSLRSHTVPDPTTFMNRLNRRSAHLFVSGGSVLKQYRIVTGAGVAAIDTPPAADPPAGGNKPAAGKPKRGK